LLDGLRFDSTWRPEKLLADCKEEYNDFASKKADISSLLQGISELLLNLNINPYGQLAVINSIWQFSLPTLFNSEANCGAKSVWQGLTKRDGTSVRDAQSLL